MAIQEVINGEDALDARNKWNNNFIEQETKIEQSLQNTFVDDSKSNTTHTFVIAGIKSYLDITNKVISFLLPQASGTSHTFNINGYGAISVKGVNSTTGTIRDLKQGEIIANKLLLVWYNGSNFILLNSNPQTATIAETQTVSNPTDIPYMTPLKTQSSIVANIGTSKSKIGSTIVTGNTIFCFNMTATEAATYGGINKTVVLFGKTG